jgi:cobalt/nickel transport system ATP-binding protein
MGVMDATKASFSYEDGTAALTDISLSVERGERVAILGPNGAGKSTLLQVLAGLKPVSSGTVRLFGQVLTKKSVAALRGRVGILFQDPDDQIFMPKVWDDVAFGPINQGLGAKAVEKRVQKALSMTGLAGYGDRVPHHLSYGEKKRVALAGVLAMRPEVLLLDEPTANLDPRNREELIAVINDLNRHGCTIITASHDMDAISELADRVYVINKRMVKEGAVRDIFLDPALLRSNNLDVPEIAKLFRVLRCFGYDCEDLPLSVDQAVDELTRKMEASGGHVHLHIHSHTPEELEKLKSTRLHLKGRDHQHPE